MKKMMTDIQKKIAECLFKDRSPFKWEVLTIIIRDDKSRHFEFLKAYTKWSVVGKWKRLREPNVLIEVQFKDTLNDSVGRRLKSLLKEYNRTVIHEKVLYFRTTPVSETSL